MIFNRKCPKQRQRRLVVRKVKRRLPIGEREAIQDRRRELEEMSSQVKFSFTEATDEISMAFHFLIGYQWIHCRFQNNQSEFTGRHQGVRVLTSQKLFPFYFISRVILGTK